MHGSVAASMSDPYVETCWRRPERTLMPRCVPVRPDAGVLVSVIGDLAETLGSADVRMGQPAVPQHATVGGAPGLQHPLACAWHESALRDRRRPP